MKKETMKQTTEQVARENKPVYSNGNRMGPQTGKPGGAERGGPDADKASKRQPPDAN